MTHLVVLDRDGVINCESDVYIRSVADLRPVDGSMAAIALLTRAGFTVAVATNQSGLARGYFDVATLNDIHQALAQSAGDAGGIIDRFVYCPHGPADHCDCRKPEPGLLHQLGAFYDIDMVGVPFIGDSQRDLAAARAIGSRAILVRTGNGAATELALLEKGEKLEVYDDLLQAARQLVGEIE